MHKRLVNAALHQVRLSFFGFIELFLIFILLTCLIKTAQCRFNKHVFVLLSKLCHEGMFCLIISVMLMLAAETTPRFLTLPSSSSKYVFVLVKTQTEIHRITGKSSCSKVKTSFNKILQHIMRTGGGDSLLIAQKRNERAHGKGWHRLETRGTLLSTGSFGFALMQKTHF